MNSPGSIGPYQPREIPAARLMALTQNWLIEADMKDGHEKVICDMWRAYYMVGSCQLRPGARPGAPPGPRITRELATGAPGPPLRAASRGNPKRLGCDLPAICHKPPSRIAIAGWNLNCASMRSAALAWGLVCYRPEIGIYENYINGRKYTHTTSI